MCIDWNLLNQLRHEKILGKSNFLSWYTNQNITLAVNFEYDWSQFKSVCIQRKTETQ